MNSLFVKIGTMLVILSSLSIYAQEYTYQISGKIIDDFGNPAEEVRIHLQNNKGNPIISNAKGNFKINSPFKESILILSKEGFEEQEVPVSFSGNENRTTYITVTLSTVPEQLGEVLIVDNPSLVTNSETALRQQIEAIPGGVNLKNLNDSKYKPSKTLKDAVGQVPGVLIQEFFGGNDQPRLNIRGSGIQSNPQARGVTLLQDGIPINHTDGSYIIGIAEPQAAHLVEIYKGSNALQYGSSTLGGAINFITKNGYNASPLSIKLEGGSWDTYNGSISSGFVHGKNDGFFSLSYNKSQGYRTYNASKRLNALANLGQRFSENFESRLIVNYTDMSFDVPGPLTRAQYLNDPKQINGAATPINLGPNVKVDQPHRESKILRVGNKSVLQLDPNNQLRGTVYYQYTDDNFYFPIAEGVRTHLSNDVGMHLRYENTTDRNRLVIGVDQQFGEINALHYINQGGKKNGLFAKAKLTSNKQVASINDIFSITPKWELNVALLMSSDYRKTAPAADDPKTRPVFNWATHEITQVSNDFSRQSFNYTGFNPKIGAVYRPLEHLHVFGNFSRSYEPPTFLEILSYQGGSVASSPQSIRVSDLKKQTASTVEIGTRGELKNEVLIWDLAFYNSWLKNELLELADINGFTGETINSLSNTVHRGVELGLQSKVWEGLTTSTDHIKLGVSYTYSDFYFKKGDYKNNRIAGIPKHYLIGNVDYAHPIGIFLNFNVEALTEKTPIDHHNELYQDPYTLMNGRVGVKRKHWGIYVEARNLTHKKYAASYLVRDQTLIPPPMQEMGAMKDNFTNFVPGVGRNFTVGLSYTF